MEGAEHRLVIVAAPTTLLERARRLVASGRRRILGIVGPPGGGKSTVARLVVAQLGDAAALVPMDGFHLAQAELVRLGRRDRMGAPDTFDADGYVALLRRLRDATDSVVYAPEFRREIEEPIAGAIAIPRSVPLVVTEGNYLLLEHGGWDGVRALLDESWYVEVDEETRIERLVKRHVAFGKAPGEAREWTMGSDQRNAEVVARTAHRADLVVRLAESG
ncbi:MAG: nucleoside/nucleotide kinase family protein [Actinobacteria bacterium]|nr:MAG: nucleoside/nucleotide kinase family protein [Actinomycetota bacterium]